MPDSPLVELKRALNTVVPQIIDRGHTALALDENASDTAFIDSYSKTIESVQVFLSSGSSGLAALAGNNASLLSSVKVTGELDEATLAALDMLATASAADTSNSGAKQTVDLINQVVAKARALPEAQRSALNTESARRTGVRNPEAVNGSPEAQARELMAISDSYLGVTGNPASNTDVLENTGRALKDYLKEQQAANPDIEIDFTPQTVDGRTAAFLQELLKKKMEAAGVRPEALRDTLFQIWLMQKNGQIISNPAMAELGRTGAMVGLVDYIVTGRVPSGSFMPNRPRTDSPWENPVQDRFFNRAVYVDLLNGDRVSNKALLRPDGADPGQQQLIREVMGQLGITTDKQTYSRDEVAKIATEIMVHQAKQLCIDEKDISSAMLEGRFNPDLDDVMLAHEGMGKPPRDQARMEQLSRIGIGPGEQHDVFFSAQFQRYRDQLWADRFGGVNDESLFRLAQRLRPDIVPQDMSLTYDQMKGHQETEALMADLRSRKITPASLFMWGSGGHADPFNLRDAYARLRSEKYLPALREAANEGGLNLCATDRSGRLRPGGPQTAPGTGDTTCFADEMDGPCEKPAGGQGGDTVCYADDTEGPCATGGTAGERAPSAADDGKCYADDFGSACGKPEGGADETIRRNAGDATGQRVEDSGQCYADDMAGPDCTKGVQAVPAR